MWDGKGLRRSAFSSLVMVRRSTLKLADADGSSLSLISGQVATLPASELTWFAEEADCVIVTLRADNPDLALEALDLMHPLSPGGAPNVALLDTPIPKTQRHTFFERGKLSWGLWSATPYRRHVTAYGFTEIMWVSRGSASLTDAAGESARFEAGEICVACAGAEVAWENVDYIEKFWLIRME